MAAGTSTPIPTDQGVLCSRCNTELGSTWTYCTGCGGEILWRHRLRDDGTCACGLSRCPDLERRLSEKLARKLALTTPLSIGQSVKGLRDMTMSMTISFKDFAEAMRELTDVIS